MKNVFVASNKQIPPSDIVGKKAYNLYLMQSDGFPVPNFVVIPSTFIVSLYRPVKNESHSILKELDNVKIEEQKEIFKGIQIQIEEFIFPDNLTKQIINECELIFGKNFKVSVRSSACVEDGNRASFAGQFGSFLNCSSQELIETLKKCISSYFSFESFVYRKSHKIHTGYWDFGIIVQEMIDSSKSGIAFSVDQTNNMADAVIVAGYGLGDEIVSGRVNADTYKVERTSKNISSKIKSEAEQQSSKPRRGNKNSIPFVLDYQQIQEVFDWSLKAEKLLGQPSDIEFCFDENNKLQILQMRPITALSKEKLIILDNTNIVESYPGITFPLTFSFALKSYHIVFKNAASHFLLSAQQKDHLEPAFSNLLAHFKGRIYYRLDNWYAMTDLVYKSKNAYTAWQNAVGLKDSSRTKEKVDWIGRIKISLAIIWMLIAYPVRVRNFFSSFNKIYKKFNDPIVFKQSLSDVWKHIQFYSNRLFKSWDITIINDFLAFRAFELLKNTLYKYGISNDENLANDLIAGHFESDSELAFKRILDIKDMIKADSRLTGLFELPAAEIVRNLYTQQNSNLKQKLDEYLERFGDRNLAELKLETSSLKENKNILIEIIKGQLKTELTANSYLELKKNKKNEVHTLIYTQIGKYSFRALRLWIILKFAAKGLKNRENMRFCRARAFGVIRFFFIEIAKSMVNDDVITDVNDVFYLDVDHLEKYCTTVSETNLIDYIAEIKSQFHDYENISLPDRIIYSKGNLPSFEEIESHENSDNILKGIAVSKGQYKGQALVLEQPDFHIDVNEKILVTKMTDPGWVFLISQAGGIISEKGSVLSHTAIICRELGIPFIVDINKATSKIKTGQIISIDGGKGLVSFE